MSRSVCVFGAVLGLAGASCAHLVIPQTTSVLLETDGVVRPVFSPADVAILLDPPKESYRVIGVVAAYDDADASVAVVDDLRDDYFKMREPDGGLWQALRNLAGALSAHALLFKQREVTNCDRPAQVVSTAEASTTGGTAATIASGRATIECVRVTAAALILAQGPLDCEVAQVCRVSRKDAMRVDGATTVQSPAGPSATP